MTRSSQPSASSPGDEDPRARTLTRFRRWGYRYLAGDLFSYVIHLRPQHWPTMAVHFSVGFVLATGFPVRGGDLGAFALGCLAWTIFLSSGNLALNTAFDRDYGDIGYVAAPPRPPRHLTAFSVVWLLLGLGIALLLPLLFLMYYATCVMLAFAYSVPPIRLKATPWAGWLVNIAGYGALTPLAGWSLSGRPLEPWLLVVVLGFSFLFAALYPLTQLYQLAEDSRRGDRTLALVLGIRRSLQLAIAAAGMGFLCFGIAVALQPASGFWPALLLPAWLWFRTLRSWYWQVERLSPRDHQRLMYRAGSAWFWSGPAIMLGFGWLGG